MFKKQGVSEKILSVVGNMKKKEMQPVLCSECQTPLKISQADDFVYGVTDKITVIGGKMIVECMKCGYKNII